MANKINLNRLTQYMLDKNYIDYSILNGYSYGARECNHLFSIDGDINGIPFKAIFLNDNERWGERGKGANLKKEFHLDIIEIFPLDISKGRFDKTLYNSIKTKIKREFAKLEVVRVIDVLATMPINISYAQEDYQSRKEVRYDVNVVHSASELVESVLYGEIKYLTIYYQNKEIAKNNGAKFCTWNKKWYYFPMVSDNGILKEYEV